MTDLDDRLAGLSAAEKRALLASRLHARSEEVEAAFDLSPGQAALWFLDRIAPASTAYHVWFCARIRSGLERPALRRALQRIVDRHGCLRTRVPVRDGVPRQEVRSHIPLELSEIDASRWSDDELHRRLVDEAHRPFDLERGPLFRGSLHSLGAEGDVLLVSAHHIVCDFWSLVVLLEELRVLYPAERSGKSADLPELPLTYQDHVRRQAELVEGDSGRQQLEYWRRELEGAPVLLNLPSSKPRPAVQTFDGATHSFVLDADLTSAVRELARSEGVTFFVVLLAAYQLLLHRYSGQQSILVGAPASARTEPRLEGIVGYFANMVVLRADFATNVTVSDFLQQVRRRVLGALENQDYPFSRLVEKLHPQRDPSASPVFQCAFALEQSQHRDHAGASLFLMTKGEVQKDLGGLELEHYDLENRSTPFELSLVVEEAGGLLHSFLNYNTNLLDADGVARMGGHYEILLREMVRGPRRRVLELPLLDTEERIQILEEWNRTERSGFDEELTVDRIERSSRRRPNEVAVIADDERLTYAELDARANRLAHHLRTLGVESGSSVVICLERTSWMPAAVLAVMKAGAAYVPADLDYPPSWIESILRDTAPAAVLTERRLAPAWSVTGTPVFCPRDEADVIVAHPSSALVRSLDSDNLAYTIYTSGSTGPPKGVQIEHGALASFLRSMQEQPGITEDDTLLAVTTLCFDISALEILLPLTVGGRVALATAETASDGPLLVRKLEEVDATVMQATPATWQMLVATGWEGRPDLAILCGGETLPRPLANALLTRGRSVWNLYGPTETTIWSCAHEVSAGEDRVPVGRPIANTRTYVLDPLGNPLPIGVPGELYIGGSGVARGYLHRPELTAQRFVTVRLGPMGEERVFRTGDAARLLPDGSVDFLGRRDGQVKVRGFRIELGGIEHVLARHPSVVHCVVVAVGDQPSDRRLVAYYVPSPDQEPRVSELRAFVRESLPAYAVPSLFIALDAFPLTASGKVDRERLPGPEGDRPSLDTGFVEPRTDTERWLAELWAEAMGVSRVGVDDNFFDLGGHSLLAVQIVARAADRCGVRVPLAQLLRDPTVGKMAALIDDPLPAGVPHPASPDLLAADTELADDIHLDGVTAVVGHEPTSVLLTGATGFLGAFLLRDLLLHTGANVSCLVRTDSTDSALRRVRDALASYGIWEDGFEQRVTTVCGDVARTRLGLTDPAFEALSEGVGAIYHSAAAVNFLLPYQELKAANVLGTEEILRLAARGRIKSLHFVSTLAVFGEFPRSDMIEDDADLADPSQLFTGYAQSKWVAEKLTAHARARGLPVTVYRPGVIGGDHRTGASNPRDLFSGLLQAFVRSGSAPDLDMQLQWTPVDKVSKAIVDLSLSPESPGRTFHFPVTRVTVAEIRAALAAAGYPMRLIPYGQWRSELLETSRDDVGHPLYAYTPLLHETDVSWQAAVASTMAPAAVPGVDFSATRGVLPADHPLFVEEAPDAAIVRYARHLSPGPR